MRQTRVMDVWLYSGANGLYALTRDQDAANLPHDLGPWTALRATTLSVASTDEAEAMELIKEHGFCCFD